MLLNVYAICYIGRGKAISDALNRNAITEILISMLMSLIFHFVLMRRGTAISEALKAHGMTNAVVHAPYVFKYGCHHSKFMIVEYPMGLRVIITTANFIPCDCTEMSQGIFWQDFPLKVHCCLNACIA